MFPKPRNLSLLYEKNVRQNHTESHENEERETITDKKSLRRHEYWMQCILDKILEQKISKSG